MKTIERLRELYEDAERDDRIGFDVLLVKHGPALLAVVEAAEKLQTEMDAYRRANKGTADQFAKWFGRIDELEEQQRKALRSLEGEA